MLGVIPGTIVGGAAKFAAGGSPAGGLLSTGLGLLKGVGGLFGGSDYEQSSAAAYAGGNFHLNNAPVYNKPMIDLDEPLHIAVLAGAIVLGIYAWKKVK